MRFFVILTAALLFATPAFAADVDRKWAGSMSTPGGDFTVGFSFKADGPALSGTTTGPDGAEIPIKNGKVEGGNISFDVTLDFGGMPFTIYYKGVVSSGQIKIVADAMGMPFEFVLKKAQ